jgi:hypothetical protein
MSFFRADFLIRGSFSNLAPALNLFSLSPLAAALAVRDAA